MPKCLYPSKPFGTYGAVIISLVLLERKLAPCLIKVTKVVNGKEEVLIRNVEDLTP